MTSQNTILRISLVLSYQDQEEDDQKVEHVEDNVKFKYVGQIEE